MIEICPNLYIGNEYDVPGALNEGWAVIHACKEPFHRRMLGYKTQGAPKNHPEYYFGIRGNRLILNLVDAEDVNYIPKCIIDKSLEFIGAKLSEGYRVLVHCNQGMSRSAGIGLLYLASIGSFKGLNFTEAETKYRLIYPRYSPSEGMREYMKQNWIEYSSFDNQA